MSRQLTSGVLGRKDKEINVLRFDGTTFIDIPSYNFSGALSVSLFCKLTELDIGHTIIGKFFNTTGSWLLFTLPTNEIRAIIWGTTALTGNMIYNEWIHVCLVFQPSTSVHIYVNNSPVVSHTGTTSASTGSNNPARIGARNDGSSPFFGYMSKLQMFHKALSESERNTLFAGGVVSDGLFLRYDMDEGDGTTANDLAGSLNGTITNPNWEKIPNFLPL